MLNLIPKNITRSISKHIEANFSDCPIFHEGQTQRDDAKETPYIELRFDGPDMMPMEKGRMKCQFEVNILIVSSIHASHYEIDEIGGNLINILYQDISIIDMSDVHLGCASPRIGRRDKIEFHKFGVIDPNSELMQATVEVHFDADLET